MIDVRALIGTHDILFITLDTLRWDVAERALREGRTPNLQRVLPNGKWERRHSPATFTYAAHQAFFSGFLPTPITNGPHPRLFATAFPGSLTTTSRTAVFETADIVSGLRLAGYYSICIGGVGFFNQRTPLGRVLPDLFDEAHWDETLGVTSARSTELQVTLAIERLRTRDKKTVFLFINVSAMHEPNRIFSTGHDTDCAETQADALAYADGPLGKLLAEMQHRGESLCIICSDHGTAYGEDGYHGHRLSHPVVLDVPYGEFVLPATVRHR